MCTVEAGGMAVRAAYSPQYIKFIGTGTVVPTGRKLLDAGYQVNKTSIPRPRATCLKGHSMTRRIAMRPAITTFAVTYLPLGS